MVGVKDRSGKTAAGPLRDSQGVNDQVGAHMIGDRPARRREHRSMTVAKYSGFAPATGR